MGVGNGADVEDVEEKNAGVQAAGSEANAGRERSWVIGQGVFGLRSDRVPVEGDPATGPGETGEGAKAA